MLKKLYVLSCLLVLFIHLVYAQQSRKEIRELKRERDRYLFAVEPLTKSFREDLPVQIVDGMFIIPVVIRGKVYRFVYDSGAVTVISDSLQRELGLRPVMNRPVTDAAGTRQAVNYYMLDSVQLGKVVFGRVGAAMASTNQMSKMACMRIDGLLGVNVMRTCYWKIDYLRSGIALSDKPFDVPAGALKIAFTENFTGTPTVMMRYGQYNFRAAWDCGNNGLLDLPDSLFFKSTASARARKVKGHGSVSLTLFENAGQTEHRVIIDTLFMDGYSLLREYAGVNPAPEALIGNRFMARFRTVIPDYKAQVLYLEDRPTPYEPDAFRSFGVKLNLVGRQLMIVFLWDSSVAQQQGLRLGDVVTAVNGQAADTLTDEEWCRLRNEIKNDRLQLTITVKGKQYTLPWEDFLFQ